MMGRPKLDPGLLLVDKPAGVTSHDVVSLARRALGERRIGHTGTLDPFATGLLLLCTGTFTRAVEYFHVLTKTYEAVMRLGRETTTGDASGETVMEAPDRIAPAPEVIEAAVGALTGVTEQVPSTFSAKRVGGVRAYEAARAGTEVALAAVPIRVHEARVTRFTPPDVGFTVRVSTGTYVRALARDVGRELGVGAHLTELRRTRIGPYSVDDALPPADLAAAAGSARVPAVDALGWLGRRDLTEAEATEIGHGRPIEANGAAGLIRLVEGGRLAAIGEGDGTTIRPRKVFPA